MSEEKKQKKNTKKTILKIIGIVVVIILIILAIPIIAFWSIFKELFVLPSKPKEKHGEFPFELVYEYKGEKITINDTITCDYEGTSFVLEGGNKRDWKCEFENDDEYGYYYIDKENYPELYIAVPEYPEYYMGNASSEKEFSEPYIHYIDEETGTYYEEKEEVEVVGVKIIEWKPSKPLKNNIK